MGKVISLATVAPEPTHLGDNEFCIFWAVQLQLLGDVGQGDPGVGQADHAHTWGGTLMASGRGQVTTHQPTRLPVSEREHLHPVQIQIRTCLNHIVSQSDN